MSMGLQDESPTIVRRGEITEIVGRLSSGRTSLLVKCLGDTTRGGAMVALVDVDHAFDPLSAERAGVDLGRLLWVRCGRRRDLALRATDLLVRCPGFALVALDLGENPPHLRFPLAFRLKLAVRRANTALLILGCRRMVGPAAALAVETRGEAPEWAGPGTIPTHLARVRTSVTVLRALGMPPVAVTPRAWARFEWCHP